MECSTLVLDLDGTLSDPSLGITRCFNHALKTFGFNALPEEQIAREIGPPLDGMFLNLVPSLDAAAVPELVATYRERYADIGYAENTVYDGIAEALAALASSGLAMGVCTSKRRDFAEKIVSMFELSRFFTFIDGGDIGITKAMQLGGLLESGAIDGKAVMVGDRSVDIASAQENNLRSIGVLWGFGSHAELSAASPSKILQEIAELPGCVN